MYRSVILSLLLCTSVAAHEMTPTYPKWKTSYIDGIHKATMEMFNTRADVKYYEIGIFDEEWKPSNQGITIPIDMENTRNLFQGLVEILSLAESKAIIEENFRDLLDEIYL